MKDCNINCDFDTKLNLKQEKALELIAGNTNTLLEGGSRSGKTYINLRATTLRALRYENSKHLVARFRFNHAKQSICYETMPEVLKPLDKSLWHLNRSEWFYEFYNGSTIWVGGLDDKERTEKILGNEYATIFCNEASQISYDSIEILSTRLNPPKGVPARQLYDYNPPSMRHWGYQIFHNRKFPDGRDVPENDYAVLKMNPIDNLDNLHVDYIHNLENLSERKRKRFLEGEYSTEEGTLWNRDWISYDSNIGDLTRVVIGVDPSGSVGGDEIGIIVCAKRGDKFIVLEDYSLHGTPAQWSREVERAWDKWNADKIVAEKNYGGDMVADVIKRTNDKLNVKLVTSSRGKVLRAEPISALYEQSKVKHRKPFLELEDEMCNYKEDDTDSPNRMDALVFALSELSGIKVIKWEAIGSVMER